MSIPIAFDLPEVVSGIDTIAILADGRFAFRKITDNTYSVASGYSQTHYRTNSSLSGTSWDTSGVQYCMWIEAETRVTTTTGMGSATDFRNALVAMLAKATGPKLVLASTYFATAGIEFSLYFDHILLSPDGRWAPDAYDFKVTCSVGQQQQERFVVKEAGGTWPATAGTYPLTIAVYHDGVLCDTRTVSLVVAPATAGGSATRKFLQIGDSLTAQGQIQTEIVRCSADDANLDVSLIGTITATNIPDSSNTNRTFNHAGVSGVTYTYMWSDSMSPFVMAGAGTFNFAAYLTAGGLTMAASDTVGIRLGINDVLDRTTDEAVRVKLGLVKTALDGMITSIRAGVSGIRINVQIPTLPVFSQDAAGDDYQNSNTRYRSRRNMQLIRQYLIDNYDTAAQRTNLVFVTDDGASWDNVNNVRVAASAAINARTAATVTRARDLVHPGGYGATEGGGAFQIADSLGLTSKTRPSLKRSQ